MGVSAKNREKKRNCDIKLFKWYENPLDFIKIKECNIIVELIGKEKGISYELVKKALENKTDIGSTTILKKYQTKLHFAAAPIYLATNSIVNLYTSNILPAKLTRQFVLRFVNTIKPAKQVFLNMLK